MRIALWIGLVGLVGVAMAEPPKKVAVPPTAAKAIARINELRKIAGLDPVTYDAERSLGCVKHAKYLVLHDDRMWGENSLDAHNEEEGLAGYSAEGKKAGQSAVIAWREPISSIDDHFNGLFHRVPILNPQLRTVAVGDSEGTKWGHVSVIDVIGGIDSTAPWPKDQVVIFPVQGQRGVPTALANELPNPIPEDSDGKGGYPITATFAPGVEVKGVKATLKNAKTNRAIEFWLSSPEKPADARYQRNTVCLIAESALSGGTAFSVTIEAVVDGEAWKRSWSFSTAGK